MRTLAFVARPKRRYRQEYNSSRWKRVRKAVLERDRRECQIRLAGCLGVASQADHIIPSQDIGEDDPLFFDMSNLQAACAPCNRRKWGGAGERRSGGLILNFSRTRR